MASLQFTCSFNLIKSLTKQINLLPALELKKLWLNKTSNQHSWRVVQSYKVSIEHEGKITELEVEPDETIPSKALDSGMSVPRDWKLGVCMSCPTQLLSGQVDQSEGMLSDDKLGFALLCAAYPRSDCKIRTIPEEQWARFAACYCQ